MRNPPTSDWSALLHELNQPITAILSNAQAAQRFLANEKVDLAELRDILDDIVADDKRAAMLIRTLSALLKESGEVGDGGGGGRT